jgi:hypothetical protein
MSQQVPHLVIAIERVFIGLLLLRLFLLSFLQLLFRSFKFSLEALHHDLIRIAILEHFFLWEVSHHVQFLFLLLVFFSPSLRILIEGLVQVIAVLLRN